MECYWFPLAFLVAAMYGIANISDRAIVRELSPVPLLSASLASIYSIPPTILIYLWGIQDIDVSIISWCILAGACFAIFTWLYFHSLQYAQTDIISSVIQSSAIFYIFFGYIFLGESAGLITYAGIIIIIAGVTGISFTGVGSLDGENKNITKAVVIMIAATFIYAAASTMQKFALINKAHILTVFFWARIGNILVVTIAILFYSNLRVALIEVFRSPAKAQILVGLNELFYLTIFFTRITALSKGPLSVVAPIIVIQPFFVLIFGYALGC